MVFIVVITFFSHFKYSLVYNNQCKILVLKLNWVNWKKNVTVFDVLVKLREIFGDKLSSEIFAKDE